MKITCTKEEKERLMTCISDAFFFPCTADCTEDCDKCVKDRLEQEIEWEVTDDGRCGKG